MAVHHIQQHYNAHSVRGVDQLLEIIGEAISTARCKEAVDLVSKTSVVRMLHYSHQLYDIVPEMLDAWEHVPCEFFVGRNFGVGRGDADVGFVDAGGCGLWRALVLENIFLVRGRVPETRIVYWRNGEVLGDAGDPSGDSFLSGVVVGCDEGDLWHVLEIVRDVVST